jgi:hypothetical protein
MSDPFDDRSRRSASKGLTDKGLTKLVGRGEGRLSPLPDFW